MHRTKQHQSHRSFKNPQSKPGPTYHSHLARHRQHPHSILRSVSTCPTNPKADKKTTLSKSLAPRVRPPSVEHVDTSTSPYLKVSPQLDLLSCFITPTPLHVLVPFSGPLCCFQTHVSRSWRTYVVFVLWKRGFEGTARSRTTCPYPARLSESTACTKGGERDVHAFEPSALHAPVPRRRFRTCKQGWMYIKFSQFYC